MRAFHLASGGLWRGLSGAAGSTTPPSPPAVVGASPGDGQIVVHWLPPLNIGGSAITGYQATASPGGASASVGAGTTQATISGLVNETEYTITVRATNSAGQGPTSRASAPVVPVSTAPVVRRDATNTGVLGVYDSGLGRNLAYSDLTTWTGSVQFSTASQTVYRQDILGPIIVAAHNITFSQCRIRFPAGTGGPGVIRKSTAMRPVGTQFVDCEIDGQGVQSSPGVYPSGSAPASAIGSGWGWTLIRCRVRRCVDILNPNGNPSGEPVTVQDSLLTEPIQTVGASDAQRSHNDVIQIAGTGTAGGIFIQRSTLDGTGPGDLPQVRQYASSAVTFDGIQAGATISNLVFEDNYCTGVAIAVRGRASNTTAVYRRNRFGTNLLYGARSSTADNGWQGSNVWDAAGTTGYGATVLAGQVIP